MERKSQISKCDIYFEVRGINCNGEPVHSEWVPLNPYDLNGTFDKAHDIFWESHRRKRSSFSIEMVARNTGISKLIYTIQAVSAGTFRRYDFESGEWIPMYKTSKEPSQKLVKTMNDKHCFYCHFLQYGDNQDNDGECSIHTIVPATPGAKICCDSFQYRAGYINYKQAAGRADREPISETVSRSRLSERIKRIEYNGRPGCYIVISGEKLEKDTIDAETRAKPVISFLYAGEVYGAEWFVDCGVLETLKKVDKMNAVLYPNIIEHWHYRYAERDGSSHAVISERLSDHFLLGDYDRIFDVLQRWSKL